MKIGYPCINRSIGCRGNKTFRLKSYSEERLVETVENNLSCLSKILDFNIENNIFFFRVTSDLVPFASHSVCTFDWQEYFKKKFEEIGKKISQNNIRISMHPDQFIVINSKREQVVERSIKELRYHAEVLDLMKLDNSSKIQLHVGGAYGDKKESINRFIKNYNELSEKITNRLVIENDDKIYNASDCLNLHKKTGIPILFDYFHHKINNNHDDFEEIFSKIIRTWTKNDGMAMVDYSSQKPNERPGAHTEEIDIEDFKYFLDITKPYDFDVMFEIKDKEKSVLKVLDLVSRDIRFIKNRMLI